MNELISTLRFIQEQIKENTHQNQSARVRNVSCNFDEKKIAEINDVINGAVNRAKG